MTLPGTRSPEKQYNTPVASSGRHQWPRFVAAYNPRWSLACSSLWGGVVGFHRMYLNRPFFGWLLLLGAMAWGATQPPFGGAETLGAPPWPPPARPLPHPALGPSAQLPGRLRSRPHRCLLQPRSLPGRPRRCPHSPQITAAAPPPQKPKDLRTLLLHAAHRGDGKLTVTQDRHGNRDGLEACGEVPTEGW